MKVSYTEAFPFDDKVVNPTDPNAGLTLGHTYMVFSIDFSPNGEIKITVRADDDGTPCLKLLQMFNIVDSRIPPDWCFSGRKGSYYYLEPKEFSGDFWERYHDADPSAEKIFDEVLKKLDSFHAQ
jgi:hypothetical protein